jgi:hypothetical protein
VGALLARASSLLSDGVDPGRTNAGLTGGCEALVSSAGAFLRGVDMPLLAEATVLSVGNIRGLEVEGASGL